MEQVRHTKELACRGAAVIYPQHFLNLRLLPQGQGSFRPTLDASRLNGF